MFQCWQCKKRLQDVILPMSRREVCSQCDADQHVCRMCMHFDGRCNEEQADSVRETERANFCDYFAPSDKVFAATETSKAEQAKIKLAELFGDPLPTKEQPDLTLSPQELAEKKLRDLLG